MRSVRFIAATVATALMAGTAYARTIRIYSAPEASNKFGLESVSHLFKAKPEVNVVYSPISAHLALGLLANGADGQTASQILRALNLQTLGLTEVNRQTKALIAGLTSRPEGELVLKIANGVWAKPSAPLLTSYKDVAMETYNAEVDSLNSAEQVNHWAARNTNNLITNIVDDVRGLEMMLANATYFKADWTQPFQKAQPRNFHGLRSTSQAQLMTKKDYLKYSSTDGVEAIEIPYGQQRLASMVLIMPSNPADFASLRASLTESRLGDILYTLTNTPEARGYVTMPKFDFATQFDMNPALNAMGMVDAFGGAADFSKLSPARLNVSYVKQDAVIKVHEKGTEAAAVTSIGIEATSVQPTPAFHFTADRPFIYVIRDHQTDTILFIGQVVQL